MCLTVATLLIPTLCFNILYILVAFLVWGSRGFQRPTYDREASFRANLRHACKSPYWAVVRTECNRPKVWKLMIWVMLFCYPSIARKSLSVFDCVKAGHDTEGNEIFLVRNDPAAACYDDIWYFWAVSA